MSLTEYQSYSASRQVLGCLIVNPLLLAEHPMDKTDFADGLHQVLFYATQNLYLMGATKLDAVTISNYLNEHFIGGFSEFNKHNGIKLVQELTNPNFINFDTFEANYMEVRKFSLLRKLKGRGIDVGYFYDPDEVNAKRINIKRQRFEKYSIEDILLYYKNILSDLSEKFNTKSGREYIKAGSDKAKEQKEKWKRAPDYGIGYASQYFTAVTSGMRLKRVTLGSAPSGTGKTRLSIANLCHSFVARYYDPKQEKFVDNPHGTQNVGLYIGTEMELIEEIEPILWAYIACVDEKHILTGEYLPGEEERVDEAIKILDEESHIYLAYIPDYDMQALETCIETHVNKYGVTHVIFDYIHTTTDLISEFQGSAKARMTIREDQVLLNLCTKIKEWTRKYGISFDTWTQTNGDVKNIENRDSSVIRGGKSSADKFDVCYVTTNVTEKELKLLEKITRRLVGKNKPNVCLSVYKNRGGEYSKVKIWLYVDYKTMRVDDLFVTNYDYEKVNMQKLYTGVQEDQVITSDNKEDFRKLMNQRMEEIEIMKKLAKEEKLRKQKEGEEDLEVEEEEDIDF